MLKLSALPKTWIFDVDGTIVIHNGHLSPEGDRLLPGVQEFFQTIPKHDLIVLITAREDKHKESLIKFLSEKQIRFDHLISGAPTGERILVNDSKPSGLLTAFAINKERDASLDLNVVIDESL
ncbi:hypothetical protein [Sutterella megalosphaeroides]|uniref:FCP1 homology domain-containing protein n=1 Tax=Sutterella megalosphaeroides TaxID=2494234 RepID=A0A2Z6IAJ9_9BURK|nr:hypothetical protein [Sutterella megalosphaeroides]BBF23563.1 hypothetical protein SUTMEG_14540 [Sutterella megalosphaeroides]